MRKKVSNYLIDKTVVILFAIICIFCYISAKMSFSLVMSEVVIRLMRNSILVMSLIIPIVAGIGLNFGVILGAMAAQIAIVFGIHWRLVGVGGYFLCLLFGTGLALLFGWLLGMLFNKTKGQEMITGLIVGFFADGLYQLLFVVIIGSIWIINDPEIIVDVTGTVKDSMKMIDGMGRVLNNAWRITFAKLLPYLFGFVIAVLVIRTVIALRKKQNRDQIRAFFLKNGLILLASTALFFAFSFQKDMKAAALWTDVYMVPVLFAALVGVLITVFLKTKLGQNMRTVGQNREVAAAAGINVNRVRIIATMLSTVLACWGQMVALQDLTTFSTYYNHESVGTLAVATLLLGGASNKRATIPQVVLGLLIFHTMFVVAPPAANNMFGDVAIGEYFRTFASYFVIALSLALHSFVERRSAAQLEIHD